MSGYTETIRRWATDNRRAGILSDADGTGEIGLDTRDQGKQLAVRFTLKIEYGRVGDARYQVYGCGFSMAACAAAAELAVGCRLEDVWALNEPEIAAVLGGLPEDRGYCAELAVRALHAAARSANSDRKPSRTSLSRHSAHGARVTAADPVYAALLSSPAPQQARTEDRHLFACLLAVAAREPWGTAAALGLEQVDLQEIRTRCFPGAQSALFSAAADPSSPAPPQASPAVLDLLLAHSPVARSHCPPCTAVWLARILAARAAHPGHLWVAMGLFARSELSAAIQRHLPSLAAANHQNMRWKRYLYKQVCEGAGGTLCKAPNCGVCTDYTLCFAPAETHEIR